jgi:hypothetical protein
LSHWIIALETGIAGFKARGCEADRKKPRTPKAELRKRKGWDQRGVALIHRPSPKGSLCESSALSLCVKTQPSPVGRGLSFQTGSKGDGCHPGEGYNSDSEYQKAGTKTWSPAFSMSRTLMEVGVCSSGKHQDSVTEASRTIQLTDAPHRGVA